MSDCLPFFVVGQARSGTTALARLLNSLPYVICLHQEGNLLYRLWQTLQRVDVLSEPVSDLVMDFEVTARHNLLNRPLDKNNGKRLFSERDTDDLIQSYRQNLLTQQDARAIYKQVSLDFFHIFSRAAGAQIVGDKVPDFIYVPDHITTPHPDSLIISISRDPRAVVHSTLEFNRNGLHLFAVNSAFAMAVAYCLKQEGLNAFLQRFDSKRALSFTHKELLASPQHILDDSAIFFNISTPPKIAGTSNIRIKDWRRQMHIDDQETVTAVCSAFGLLADDESKQKYREKAAAIHQIARCQDDKITEFVRHADISICESLREKEEFGLAIGQIADYVHKRGDFLRSELLYANALAFAPDDPVLLYKYSLLCYDRKLKEKTVSHLKQCVECCPETPYFIFLKAKSYYLAGMTERLLGNYNKAEFFMRNALSLKPDFILPARMLQILEQQKVRL